VGKLDGIVTTILAGVIVALIGAYAAYYFGGLRERHKQEEEAQKELSERRADAVAELRSRASSVGEALKSWANKWARIPEKIPRAGPSKNWAQYGSLFLALHQQEDSLLNSMSSLREFYQRQSPYLEAKHRRLYESFDKDFDSRYTTLSKHLDGVLKYRTTAESKQFLAAYEQLVAQVEIDQKRLAGFKWLSIPFAGRWRRKVAKEVEREQENFSGLPEAARPAQEWDLQAHLRAFDAEAERLASLASR
jgi:DNA repair exonuclease SbcCD ATPase subunit